MATKNDITGDALVSRGASKAYLDNYDLIFKKKNEPVQDSPSTERTMAEMGANREETQQKT